jgi:hypothetical protein
MHGLALISDGLMFGLSVDLMAEGLVTILTTVEVTGSGLFLVAQLVLTDVGTGID